jgi:putative ABC transport system permease protein
MGTILGDLRFGFRMIKKNPAFSAFVILLQAVGIGATASVYSIVDGVLIRPLPYTEPDHIINIWETDPPVMQGTVSAPNFLDWKRQATAFEQMSAFAYETLNLSGDGEPERLTAFRVSPEYFSLLGASPAAGRSFSSEEAKVGRDDVVILSHELWSRRYAGDRGIIGRAIKLNGRSCNVIGVMPKGFRAPLSSIEPSAWVPLAFGKSELESRGDHYLFVLARLKAAKTLPAATSEMEAIARSLSHQYPDTNRTRGVGLESLRELTVEGVRPALLILMGAVVLVLLIACANVANLLLARATARRAEFAIRGALGASRGVLVRQLLVESAVLGVLGGGAGLLLALWMTDLALAFLPPGFRLASEIAIDGKVAALSLALSLVTSLVFGLVPALQTAGGDISGALREAGARASAGRSRARAHDALVVAEIAFSLTLAVGATLLIRSYRNLRQLDLGFDPGHVVAVAISIPEASWGGQGLATSAEEKARDLFDRLLERIEGMSGIDSVGLVNLLPLDHFSSNGDFAIEGRPWTGPGHPVTENLSASAEYFRTMGMALRAGRSFTKSDVASSLPVAIVNETMARRFWPSESPIGKRIKLDWAGGEWREVVGVVADVRRRSVRRPAEPETYVPFSQRPVLSATLVVRTSGEPLQAVASIRRELAALDGAQAMTSAKTLERIVDDSLAQQRFSTVLLGLFAAAALLLAVMGIYGVVSYQVSQRTREIGIRMALGAEQADIWKLIVGAGAKLAVGGVALGLAATLVLSSLLRSLLFGIGATDASTFAAVALLVTCVAILASYIPAWKAARIDPLFALHHD